MLCESEQVIFVLVQAKMGLGPRLENNAHPFLQDPFKRFELNLFEPETKQARPQPPV
jgi:hypothetical protein